MKAVVMTAPGGPEMLELREVPEPALERDTQMRVRLKAAGVNPVDTKLRARGTYYPDRLPAILGCDGAGVVEEIGRAVTRFALGDETYFCNGGIGGEPGNYAEQIVIEEAYAAKKPACLSFIEAAAAPLVLITAWEALHERAHVARDDTVLVHAGAGGVGHVAMQIARAAGARVATTVSTEEKAALVRELGAEKVIRYASADLVEAVDAWTDGHGVDIALDTVGGATFAETFAAVRVYGDLVTLLQPPPDADWKVARLRNLRIALELMLTPQYMDLHRHRRRQAEILEECRRLFDAGRLRVTVSHALALDEAAEAHRLVGAGSTTGKIVLVMD
ncbi:MAG: zinc-dependent alcohol dehydrogenase family protein [Gammaproteobacteria bacterium]|nr:zinc-dependent alcohol dehydrogenase family protein [Gammaproteobacteria bacterium]